MPSPILERWKKHRRSTLPQGQAGWPCLLGPLNGCSSAYATATATQGCITNTYKRLLALAVVPWPTLAANEGAVTRSYQ